MGDLVPGNGIQRQNTVNMLDPLPDLDFFSYPVDDFFDSYVTELGARGQPLQPSTSGCIAQEPSSNGARVLPQPNQPATPPVPFVSPQQQIPGLQQPSMLQLPQQGTASTAFLDLAFDNTVLNGFAMPLGAPDSQRHPTHSLQAHDIHDSPTFSAPQTHNSASKSRRNPKQQQQNKAAQQRYRERRKQRFSDMEHVIDDLSAQLKHMSNVSSQNAALQSQASQLQQLLKEREAEIKELQQKLQPGAQAGQDMAAEGQATPSEPENNMEAARRQIDDVRRILDDNRLWEGDATGKELAPAVAKQLSDAVGQASSACSQASRHVARAGGLRVLELINADHDRLRSVQGCIPRWLTVIQALRLSEEQQEQLLRMRQNHLKQLKEVYIQRQALNLKAISFMAQGAELVDGRVDAIERKLQCMSIEGYAPCNHSTVDLNHVLDAIKENLRLEQRHVMELNIVATHRVLSTVQAAVYVVMKFPARGTMLDLVNALAHQLGRNDSSTSVGGQSSSVAASSVEQGSGGQEIKADRDGGLLEEPKQAPDQALQEWLGSSDGSAFTAGMDLQRGSVQNMPLNP